MIQTSEKSLAAELKHATAQAHRLVETHPVNRALMSGRMGPGGYAQYLSQWQALHTPLEAALVHLRKKNPIFGEIVRDYHFRLPALGADLAALNYMPDGSSLSSPTGLRFAERVHSLRREHPVPLLGFLYVVEGSTNGGKFLADALIRIMGPAAEDATNFLNPHGGHQSERWADFKVSLENLSLSECDPSSVIDGALEMFHWVGLMFDELEKKLQIAA